MALFVQRLIDTIKMFLHFHIFGIIFSMIILASCSIDPKILEFQIEDFSGLQYFFILNFTWVAIVTENNI